MDFVSDILTRCNTLGDLSPKAYFEHMKKTTDIKEAI